MLRLAGVVLGVLLCASVHAQTITFGGSGPWGAENPGGWTLPSKGRLVCTYYRVQAVQAGSSYFGAGTLYGAMVQELSGDVAKALMPVYRYSLPPDSGGYTILSLGAFGMSYVPSGIGVSAVTIATGNFGAFGSPMSGKSCNPTTQIVMLQWTGGASLVNAAYGTHIVGGVQQADFIGPQVSYWTNPSPGVFVGMGFDGYYAGYNANTGASPAVVVSALSYTAIADACDITPTPYEVCRFEIEDDAIPASTSTDVPEGWYEDVLSRLTDIRTATQGMHLLQSSYFPQFNTKLGAAVESLQGIEGVVGAYLPGIDTKLGDIRESVQGIESVVGANLPGMREDVGAIRAVLEEALSGEGPGTPSATDPEAQTVEEIPKVSDRAGVIRSKLEGESGEHSSGFMWPFSTPWSEGDTESGPTLSYTLPVQLGGITRWLGVGTYGAPTSQVNHDFVISLAWLDPWVLILRAIELLLCFLMCSMYIWEEVRRY